MQQERLFFREAVEQLVQMLPRSEAMKDQLKAIGFDPDHLLPAYPQHVQLRLLALLGETLFPQATREERDFEVGRAFLRAYARTVIGGAVMAMAKVVGPSRALGRLTRNFRTVSNFIETGTLEGDATSLRVWVQPVVQPHMYRGVLSEGVALVTGSTITVQIAKFENERVEYLIRWGG